MTTTRRLSAAYDARILQVLKERDRMRAEYQRRVSGLRTEDIPRYTAPLS